MTVINPLVILMNLLKNSYQLIINQSLEVSFKSIIMLYLKCITIYRNMLRND